MSPSLHRDVLAFGLALGLILTGCSRKPPVAKTAPPPPPVPLTIATLSASPNELQQGQAAVLTWSTENAKQILISGIGKVTASGSKTVRPQASITYVLTASGPGGTKEASARVTVTSSPAASVRATPTDQELLPTPQACRKIHELNLVRPDKVPLTPADQLVGYRQSFLQEQCEYQQARNWQQ